MSGDSPLASDDRHPRGLVWVLLAVSLGLVAVMVWPLAGGRVYVAGDLGSFHLPIRQFYARCLADGEAFDWIPGLFGDVEHILHAGDICGNAIILKLERIAPVTAVLGNNDYDPQYRDLEIVELADHPWYVASQFHPEFKSRPRRPAPLFLDFVGGAIRHAQVRAGGAKSTTAT